MCLIPNAKAWTSFQLLSDMGEGINYGEYYDKKSNRTNTALAAIPASHFTEIKAKGFNHVRIPVTWGYRLNTWPTNATDPITVNATFMASVKTSVDRALAAGLVVIINTHHEEWFQYYWGNKDNLTKCKLVKSGQEQAGYPYYYETNLTTGRYPRDIYENIYTQIVQTFRGSAYDKVIFEGLNEPKPTINYWGGGEVNAFPIGTDSRGRINYLNERLFGILQGDYQTSHGARRTFLLGMCNYNNWTEYQYVTIPPYSTWTTTERVNRLMATIHYYSPFNWTHPSATPDNSWGTQADYDTLWSDFASIDATSISLSNLPTHIGEFGIAHAERTGRSNAEVTAWYAEVTQAGFDKGFAVTAWDDSGWFGIMDHTSGTFSSSGLKYDIRKAITDNY